MFCQIKINDQNGDTNYQRLVYRFEPTDEIQDFELTSVVFDMVPSQYLATRTLQQASDDMRHEFPIGTKALAEDFYIDNALTGASSVNDIIEL